LEFDALRGAFAADPALGQETEWAYRLAVETDNPRPGAALSSLGRHDARLPRCQVRVRSVLAAPTAVVAVGPVIVVVPAPPSAACHARLVAAGTQLGHRAADPT